MPSVGSGRSVGSPGARRPFALPPDVAPLGLPALALARDARPFADFPFERAVVAFASALTAFESADFRRVPGFAIASPLPAWAASASARSAYRIDVFSIEGRTHAGSAPSSRR